MISFNLYVSIDDYDLMVGSFIHSGTDSVFRCRSRRTDIRARLVGSVRSGTAPVTSLIQIVVGGRT